MKKSLALIFFSFLLLSCEKPFRIETPDTTIDGRAQTIEIQASSDFFIEAIYEWHTDDNGNLSQDKRPLGDDCPAYDYVGDWFEIHVDRYNTRIARLSVLDNNTGNARKLTIIGQFKGMEDSIRITQNSL